MATSALKPGDCDKSEMTGRMYEAIDIQSAIENGQLENLEDVLAYVKQSAAALDKLLKTEAWVFDENCCVNIPVSVRAQSEKHNEL